ncbi:MAG: hypothetical protein IGBAC_2151 [Ignavibacteriae bacterium]|nr:MAG: hypothetical protein IGBAC_2151 [Ignavibacteriota bacterium]
MEILFRDKSLIPIWNKLLNGERLTFDDGLALFRTNDLISLGKMANWFSYQKSGDAVYFVLNRKIEHTNICVLSCKFCDFAKKKGEPGAYEMTTEEILSKLSSGIREVHITGAMPPDWKWERYLDIVQSINDKFPEIDIKAYTAVEIDFFHKKFKKSIEEILIELKNAGLKTMPGGGAEIFSERVRRLLFNQKIGEKSWLEIHKTAHRLGIPSNATMLYGHIETLEERVKHLIKLREAQDETGGFLTFIPLAFQPGDTGIKPKNNFTSAIDDLKTIAVSRLMLDNFPHIKAYWVMLTEEVAAIALNFGADDIDGTVGEEHIAHDAGAISPMKLAQDRIIKIIKEAGKIAVERDVFYNPLKIYGRNIIGKIPYLNSIPIYHNLKIDSYFTLPLFPHRLGEMMSNGYIDAGLISLVDYLNNKEKLNLSRWCLSSREKVQSVLLFSKYKLEELENKKIGITDETSTSVKLLKVILEKKYKINALFEEFHQPKISFQEFDAVLLIGDNALNKYKAQNPEFNYKFDLAEEWFQWQNLPFVFAVWVERKDLLPNLSDDIIKTVELNIQKNFDELSAIVKQYRFGVKLTDEEIIEYLKGFNYKIGDEELSAIRKFEELIRETK